MELLPTLAAVTFLLSSVMVAGQQHQRYVAIFNFGDSLVDTGNLVTEGIPDYLFTARTPYGMTFFGFPTGRCSDGRLVIDFLAQAFDLPPPPPSKARNATFERGANFAITGATALDKSFFDALGLGESIWNSGSVHTELEWFQAIKPSICGSPKDCKDLFRRSLFIVGEFGGNDYNAVLFNRSAMNAVYPIMAPVIRSISRAIDELIAEGAVDIVVPGVLPIGCFPVYLELFPSSGDGRGARSGCLKYLNTLSWVHNSMLRRAIQRLRKKHPGARIIYADYYTPVVQFTLHPEKFGFYKQLPRACCGAPGKGPYNFNVTAKCGEPGSAACEDPSTHWNWDGLHLTEAAHKHIANGWLHGPYADPPIMGLIPGWTLSTDTAVAI